MLSGAGSLIISSEMTGGQIRTSPLMMPLCIAGFDLTSDSQLQEAKCLIDGKKQITSAAITETTWSLKLQFEKLDFQVLGLALDEIAQDTATVSNLPIVKTARVPAVTPFTISDTGITSGNASRVTAYQATGKKTFLTKVSATPAVGEFTAAAGVLTFNAASAGQLISYTSFESYTSVPTIGVEATADSFGTLSFAGICYLDGGVDRFYIEIPALSRVSTPNLTVTGDLATLEVEFRCSVPSGSRTPYKLYSLSQGVKV